MPSTKYIYSCVFLPDTYQKADAAIAAPPEIRFHIECYHYERRTSTDSKGRKKTRRVKVVTYRGSKLMRINTWVDQSPPSYTLNYLENIHVTRLYTDKIILMSPRARDRRRNQFSRYVNANKRRDKHHHAWQTEEIPHMYDHTLVLNEKMGDRPWFT
jgi:hypothetical protein